MDTYIIHHDADNDGLASAFIAQDALASKECVLIGHDYGYKLDQIEAIPNGSKVFMLDISLPVWDMITLAQRTNLTWIDHHERTYNELFNPLHKICNIVYGEKAACRLTWDFFNPLKLEPFWVKMVGKYDVFEQFDTDYWNDEILPFEYAIRGMVSRVYDFGFVNALENRLVEKGRIILQYLQKQVNKASEHASLIMYRDGVKMLIAIGGENGAMWYNTDIVKNNQPDLIVFPYYDFESNSWEVSLRQGVSENKIDCAELASRFEYDRKKGGGHFNAAGFRCKELPFIFTELNAVNKT